MTKRTTWQVLGLAIGLLMAVSAQAADWGHYVNERYGVEADVPPGFAPGKPPVNGDGLGFTTPTAELRVYGSFIIDTDFEGQVRKEIGWQQDDGWAVTYQAITPSWASYSGKKGGRVFYTRAIRMCGGDMIGEFYLEYPASELKKYDSVVERLVGSLKDSGSGWQC